MAEWFDVKDLPRQAPGGVFCSVEEAPLIVARPFNSGNKLFVKQTFPINLFVRRICQNDKLPRYTGVGLECYSAESGMVPPFSSKSIRLGFAVVDWPQNLFGQFCTLPQGYNTNVEVSSALVPSVNQELKVRLNNLASAPFFVNLNQPICVLLVQKCSFLAIHEMEPLKPTENAQQQQEAVWKLASDLANMDVTKK
jgi:hypothetical protein